LIATFHTHVPSGSRRPPLSGVSLLVLVAFALGASVSRADAPLYRTEGSQNRIALIATVSQMNSVRPQRRQHERPAVATVWRQRRVSGLDAVIEAGSERPANLPCLRESLVALPPPAAAI